MALLSRSPMSRQVCSPPSAGSVPATTESYQQSAPGSPGPQLLRKTLARHGLIDGKNMRLEMRLAEGRLDRLPGLAEELVREDAAVRLPWGSDDTPPPRFKALPPAHPLIPGGKS
jgi:hypothetical protein